jgi:hypothetical protein
MDESQQPKKSIFRTALKAICYACVCAALTGPFNRALCRALLPPRICQMVLPVVVPDPFLEIAILATTVFYCDWFSLNDRFRRPKKPLISG